MVELRDTLKRDAISLSAWFLASCKVLPSPTPYKNTVELGVGFKYHEGRVCTVLLRVGCCEQAVTNNEKSAINRILKIKEAPLCF